MLKELQIALAVMAVFVIVVVVRVVLVLLQINGVMMNAVRVKTIGNLASVKCMWSFYSDPNPICLSDQAKLQRGEDDG
jgi:hypothetical protein